MKRFEEKSPSIMLTHKIPPRDNIKGPSATIRFMT